MHELISDIAVILKQGCARHTTRRKIHKSKHAGTLECQALKCYDDCALNEAAMCEVHLGNSKYFLLTLILAGGVCHDE